MPGPQKRPAEVERLMGYPRKGGDGRSKSSVDAAVKAGSAIGPIGEPFSDMSDKAKGKWFELSHTWAILLKATDRDDLRIYCDLWCDLMEARLMTIALGMFIPTKDGHMREAPWSSVQHKLRIQCHKMLQDFGATPSSRQRVELNDPSKVPETSKFNGLVN